MRLLVGVAFAAVMVGLSALGRVVGFDTGEPGAAVMGLAAVVVIPAALMAVGYLAGEGTSR